MVSADPGAIATMWSILVIALLMVGGSFWLVLPQYTFPVYPSDWIEDQFITVNFDEDLRGKTFLELVPPAKAATDAAGTYASNPIYDEIFGMAQGAEAERVAGSLFGSMQQYPFTNRQSALRISLWRGYAGQCLRLTMSGVECQVLASLPRCHQFGLVSSG